jgi:hypothetical protein
MSCTIDPNHPQLQKWLKEGLSIEVHTVDHPCPLLKDGDFLRAKSTVDRCIDLMHLVPNNKPVAFRMPCCDSLNTLSPRFFAEIFNKTTPGGKRGDPGAIPMITRNGTSNGAWFHSKHLWVQNEDTAKMKDLVDRRSFEDLLQEK